MALVQCSHRRNKTNSPVLLTADFARDGTHALTAVDDLHSFEERIRTSRPLSLSWGCLNGVLQQPQRVNHTTLRRTDTFHFSRRPRTCLQHLSSLRVNSRKAERNELAYQTKVQACRESPAPECRSAHPRQCQSSEC